VLEKNDMMFLSMMRPMVIRWLMAALSLIGLFAAGYLFIVYLTGGPITCGPVAGCEVVRASSFAYVFGIPLPAFGVAFYLGIFCLLFLRLLKPAQKRLWHILVFVGVGFALIESLFLFMVQWQVLKTFCFWCLVSSAVVFSLACLVWFSRDEMADQKNHALEVQGFLLLLLIFLPAAFLGLWILLRHPEQSPSPALPISIPVIPPT
jgi:uncharacterized membrane protein